VNLKFGYFPARLGFMQPSDICCRLFVISSSFYVLNKPISLIKYAFRMVLHSELTEHINIATTKPQ